MPRSIRNVGGIILCGGKSTRMGLPKATLPFGTETLLERVIRLLSEVVQPIVVVAAPGQSLVDLPPDVLVAHDERESRGPLEGLYAGLTAMAPHADAAYATSCDVPLLVPAFVRRMIELLDDHQIAVPVDGKFHHPLAAVYQTSVLPAIESLLQADRLRPLFLFDDVETRRVPVEDLKQVDSELRTLANLNYPQDYFDALAKEGYEAPSQIVEELT